MKYNRTMLKKIVVSNKRLFHVVGLSVILAAPVYATNSTESAAKPENSGLINSNIQSQNLTNTSYFEQDALQVLTLVDTSKKLREQLPRFVGESNQAIKKHHGALPSAYTLRMANHFLRQMNCAITYSNKPYCTEAHCIAWMMKLTIKHV